MKTYTVRLKKASTISKAYRFDVQAQNIKAALSQVQQANNLSNNQYTLVSVMRTTS